MLIYQLYLTLHSIRFAQNLLVRNFSAKQRAVARGASCAPFPTKKKEDDEGGRMPEKKGQQPIFIVRRCIYFSMQEN